MHKLTGSKCPSLLVVGLAGDSSIASSEEGVGSHGERVGESAVTTKLPPGSSLPCPLKQETRKGSGHLPHGPRPSGHIVSVWLQGGQAWVGQRKGSFQILEKT